MTRHDMDHPVVHESLFKNEIKSRVTESPSYGTIFNKHTQSSKMNLTNPNVRNDNDNYHFEGEPLTRRNCEFPSCQETTKLELCTRHRLKKVVFLILDGGCLLPKTGLKTNLYVTSQEQKS